MDTQPELKNSKEIIAYLSNHFPKCFTIEGEAKPLKIGIFQDLIEKLATDEKFSKTKLRVALRSYTVSWRYLHCLKEGSNRVDLDGNFCDTVTTQQAEHAQAELKESKEKAKAKRIAANKDKPAGSIPEKTKNMTVNSRRNGTSKPVKNKASNQTRTVLQNVDVEQLKVGHVVKVLLGTKPISAVVSSIEKGHIKVKIPSGMELTVMADRILL
ncbi:RNA chaperone ProQ [Orbus wheelerorum]|uniref:RNA chaperone ProQ n=1 Tax=Orbus wheelerorum TaxID=3074111 RepID=UPI00370D7972